MSGKVAEISLFRSAFRIDPEGTEARQLDLFSDAGGNFFLVVPMLNVRESEIVRIFNSLEEIFVIDVRRFPYFHSNYEVKSVIKEAFFQKKSKYMKYSLNNTVTVDKMDRWVLTDQVLRLIDFVGDRLADERFILVLVDSVSESRRLVESIEGAIARRSKNWRTIGFET